VDQSKDADQTHLYGAVPPGGYRLQVFDKRRSVGDVRLEHAASGAMLTLELSGTADSRAASGAVARARSGEVTATWTSYIDRLQEQLILRSRPDGDRVGLGLTQRGLSFVADGSGGYLALGADTVRFHLAASAVQDASKSMGRARLELDQGQGMLWIELDPVFLKSATYPLSVTRTIAYTGEVFSDRPAAYWVLPDTTTPGQTTDASQSIAKPSTAGGEAGVAGVAPTGAGAGAMSGQATPMWAWGSNSAGQVGDGGSDRRLTPSQVRNLSSVTALRGGEYHTLGLQGDGTVWAWGYNNKGQLGIGTTQEQLTPTQVSALSGITAIGAGWTHSLAVKSDGSVWAWGANGDGQLGDGTTTQRTTPVQVSGLSGATAVAGGGSHSLAVKSDGTVWAWGANAQGQLGNGSTTRSTTPVQVSGLTGVTAVAAGYRHSLAVKSDGSVWAWGANGDGQLGDGTTTQRTTPVQVGTISGVMAIGAGAYHSLAVKGDGTAWAWGDNYYGQVGDGTKYNDRTSPVQVSGLAGATAVAGGLRHGLATKNDGSLWAWGDNPYGQLGDGTTTQRTTPVQVSGLGSATSVTAGASHTSAVKSDGTAWGWGYNLYGQVGDGTAGRRLSPIEVLGPGGAGLLEGVVEVSAGTEHSLALKQDGTVWAWGRNTYGQLGDGTTADRTTPVQVSGLTDLVGVAAGDAHSLALKFDGSVWAWGRNPEGRLGDGTTTQRSTPVRVLGPGGSGYLGPVTAIAAGGTHSLARMWDGTVWAWGGNLQGQLGDGTTTGKKTPVQVTGLTGVRAISAGRWHSLAAKSDGTAWAWGYNAHYQLGDGTSTQRNSPVQPSISGVIAVSGGVHHSLALKADGTVWGWGYSSQGEVDGSTLTYRTTPVQRGGIAGALAIGAGDRHSFAQTEDGAVWSWGYNASGQLGDGTTVQRTSPVRVGTLSGTTAIAAGRHHGLATATQRSEAFLARMIYNRQWVYIDTSLDPVNTYTGDFLYDRTDLAIPGRGPAVSFARAYSSSDTRKGPLGPGWTHSYLIRVVDPGDGTGDAILVNPQGRMDRYVRNPDGSYTPPAAVDTALVRNADGNYTATHPDQSTWTFNAGGQLVALADRHGNKSTLTYYSGGRLATIRDAAGRGWLSLDYAGGRLVRVTDWASPARSVQYEYDGTGRLWKVTDREGQVTTYGYNGTSQRLTTITDARGNVAVTNTYDAQERVATQKDARGLVTGQQTTFAYVTNGDGTKTTTVTYPATSIDPTWSPTVADTYDTQGRLIRKVSRPTSGETYTEEHTYDANSFRASTTDARGNTTNFCYDVSYAGAAIPGSRGNLTRRIDPPPTTGANRPVTLFKYDAKHNLVQTIPPRGVASGTSVTCATDLSASINTLYATDQAYDTATQTRLESVTRRYTDPDLGQQTAVTKFEYGDAQNPGLVTRMVPPRGNTGGTPDYTYATTFSYFTPAQAPTKAGLLKETVDPLGNKTTYDYDAVGRRTSMVDPLGYATGGVPAEHTWEYTYDNEDRPRVTRAPAPQPGGQPLVTELRYDPVGNKTVAIDANGQVTKYVYDERDSLKEIHQSPNAWTDPNVTPSGLIVTAYQYDHLGNLSRVTRAQGDSTNERVTDYAYDGLGRLRKEIQYPSWPSATPTLVTQYTYDGNGNRLTLVDPLGQTATFAYDALNRLTSIDYSDPATPDVTYGYDANGNRTSMVDGTGTTGYVYDELDRPTSVTSPGAVTVGSRYDLDGNRIKLIYPGGTGAVTYTFDKAGRLSSLSDWASRVTSYQYFADGSLKQATNPNGTTADLSYDNARRLLEVWNKQGASTISQHTYTLDAAGNRTQVAETLAQVGGGTLTPTITYSHDKLYRLLGDGTNTYTYDPVGNRASWGSTAYSYDRADRISAAGSTSYTVNANGNTTAKGSDTFGYDQANRLKTASVSGTTSTYVYDGDGKRASATTGGNTTSYTYDANRSLPVLLQDGTRTYVWGLGSGPIYAVSGTSLEVSHADGLGSVRALTDGAGTLIATYRTDPFGVPTATQGSSTQPFGFTGEQTDGTGLVYLRARMYDPQSGRFLQRDPIAGAPAAPASLHRYAYALNSPLTLADPSGLSARQNNVLRASLQAATPCVGVLCPPIRTGADVDEETLKRLLARLAALIGLATIAGQDRSPEPNWVVRAGVADAAQLRRGTQEHLAVPGLYGFSVQYAPGRSVRELAAAGQFPNPQISVTTVEQLTAAAVDAGYSIAVVPSPGRGYHHTVAVPRPLPDDLSEALSRVFIQMPNPARRTP
jgi:RHS repeat-associated protein